MSYASLEQLPSVVKPYLCKEPSIQTAKWGGEHGLGLIHNFKIIGASTFLYM